MLIASGLVVVAGLHGNISANKGYSPMGAICQLEVSANERTRNSMKNFVTAAK